MSTTLVDRITRAFDSNLEWVLDRSHDINQQPELGYEEYRTSALLADTFETLGDFRVERGVGDLPTAFPATVAA